jgi:hypothetical protein
MTPEMIERATAGAKKQGLTNVEFHQSTIDRIPLPDASANVVISNCVINLAPDKRAVLREAFRVLKPGGRLAVSDIALKKPLPPEVGADLVAYVGCIAGAVPIEEYVAALKAAGFSAVEVVDTKKDLSCYSEAEGQDGCCDPPAAPAAETEACCTAAPAGSSACCMPPAGTPPAADCCTPPASGSSACCTPNPDQGPEAVRGGLADLLARYDVNEFAASVQVYAVKPAASGVRP